MNEFLALPAEVQAVVIGASLFYLFLLLRLDRRYPRPADVTTWGMVRYLAGFGLRVAVAGFVTLALTALAFLLLEAL